MAANLTPDRFEKIGQNPVPPTTDTLSSTPIGSATVPAADAALAYYPVAPEKAGQP